MTTTNEYGVDSATLDRIETLEDAECVSKYLISPSGYSRQAHLGDFVRQRRLGWDDLERRYDDYDQWNLATDLRAQTMVDEESDLYHPEREA